MIFCIREFVARASLLRRGRHPFRGRTLSQAQGRVSVSSALASAPARVGVSLTSSQQLHVDFAIVRDPKKKTSSRRHFSCGTRERWPPSTARGWAPATNAPWQGRPRVRLRRGPVPARRLQGRRSPDHPDRRPGLPPRGQRARQAERGRRPRPRFRAARAAGSDDGRGGERFREPALEAEQERVLPCTQPEALEDRQLRRRLLALEASSPPLAPAASTWKPAFRGPTTTRRGHCRAKNDTALLATIVFNM